MTGRPMVLGTPAVGLQAKALLSARGVAGDTEIDSRQPSQPVWRAFPIRELADMPAVESGDGSDLWLSLVHADGSKLSVLLDAAEAVAVAGELTQATRVRMSTADLAAEARGARVTAAADKILASDQATKVVDLTEKRRERERLKKRAQRQRAKEGAFWVFKYPATDELRDYLAATGLVTEEQAETNRRACQTAFEAFLTELTRPTEI
jgi:hypothetical protein